MTQPPSKNALPRKLGQLVLAAAVLATAGRVAQLAFRARGIPRHTTPAASKLAATGSTERLVARPAETSSPTAGPSGAGRDASAATAELAELYQACPLAAVIDWQTVATSPAQAEALLPPYRETAVHVPNAMLDESIPRIRYPVPVEPPPSALTGIRVAQSPQAKNSHSTGRAADPPQSANVQLGEWLVNPQEWLGIGAAPAAPPTVSEPPKPQPTVPPAPPVDPAPAPPPPPTAPPSQPAAESPVEPPAEPPAQKPSVPAPALTLELPHPAAPTAAPPPSAAPTTTEPPALPATPLTSPFKAPDLPLPTPEPPAVTPVEPNPTPLQLVAPPAAPPAPAVDSPPAHDESAAPAQQVVTPALPALPPPALVVEPSPGRLSPERPPSAPASPAIFAPPPRQEPPPSAPVHSELLPARPLPEPTQPPAPAAAPVPPLPPAPQSTLPDPPTSGGRQAPAAPAVAGKQPIVDPHLELFTKNAYPSARECGVCHEETYHEWSVSAHAYAAVSPMFNKFEQRLNDLSQGTVGYFCLRCHSPVGVSLCLPRDLPLWKQPEAAREGITCVACHRVQFAYGKSNGERRVEQGDIHAPVFGGIGGDGVAETIARKDEFKVKTGPDEKGPGQNMHITGVYFQPLTRSEFCTPCHQVAVHPGVKLEVVWEQYRASPACKKGIQCQDCHMGRVPGLPLGYDCGPVAKMSGKTVNENRKKSNHMFHGPNYSIAHPGVFPFHLKSNRWTMEEWLTFDWRAGWGTEDFEDAVDEGQIQCDFPPVWAEADDRMDAREILDDNFKKLQLKRENRIQVMENGSRVEGPFFESPLCRGQDLNLHYIITNTNEGHNLLTASLGAQPQLWANVVLIGPDGRRLWETGYVDSAGDVANIHSQDVRQGKLAYDWQLFNLQTMFLITGAKGTDREFYVPVNLDIDQLAFIRPGVQPITTINHPPFIRMESQSLAATGSRRVPYRIPGELLLQPGRYRLSFRMRSRSEPIYFVRFCLATEEMERAMNENMIDIHPMSVEFDVR